MHILNLLFLLLCTYVFYLGHFEAYEEKKNVVIPADRQCQACVNNDFIWHETWTNIFTLFIHSYLVNSADE